MNRAAPHHSRHGSDLRHTALTHDAAADVAVSFRGGLSAPWGQRWVRSRRPRLTYADRTNFLETAQVGRSDDFRPWSPENQTNLQAGGRRFDPGTRSIERKAANDAYACRGYDSGGGTDRVTFPHAGPTPCSSSKSFAPGSHMFDGLATMT